MAYTALTPQRPGQAGAALTFTAFDTANGVKFPNDGQSMLVVENPAGGASAAVSIATAKTVEGLELADRESETIVAGTVTAFGPFPPSVYNQPTGADQGGVLVDELSGDAPDLNVAVVSLRG